MVQTRKSKMVCEEVKTPKYQTRKSPPFHAGKCPGQTKKGKDGVYESKADARGIYKWIKVGAASKVGANAKPGLTRKAPKGSKVYLVHHNGTRPYKVVVSGKTVEIYKGEYRRSLENTKAIDYEAMDYDKLVKKLTVKEVHVGKSPCIDVADWCGAPTLGNTILLHISGKKYMHIGYDIFEFTMEDEFDTYYSLVGNNDVPYPVLLGTKYVYFMLDYATMPREAFKAKMTAADWADAYRYFYGTTDLETGEPVKCIHTGTKRAKCVREREQRYKNIKKEFVRKMSGLKKL
jgi:hypothetical protein